nr:MAG TPA: hypothetical protein [Caudoviricetes sp.]
MNKCFVNLFTPACLSVKIGGRTWDKMVIGR